MIHHLPPKFAVGEPRLVLPEAPAWMDDTLCSSTDPEAFFPAQGANNRAAMSVCKACPARLPCLRFALDENIRDGIWGGMTARQRARLMKKGA